MVLACVRPDKAYELAMQACKVWFYQMKIKSKINLNNVSAKYDNMLTSVSEKYQRENYGKYWLFNISNSLTLYNQRHRYYYCNSLNNELNYMHIFMNYSGKLLNV